MLGACLVGAWSAAGAAGAAVGPELICGATETIPEVTRLKGWLRLDFVVKPQSRELCRQDHCLALTDAGGGRLQYRCSKATGGGYCLGSFESSTAGPFVYEETLTVDPAKGAFESVMTGSVGDITPLQFDVRVVGACRRTSAEAAAVDLALRAVLRLPLGVQGRAYGPVRLLAGEGPKSVSIVKGALPPGLTISPEGFLAGTPRRAGTFQFVLRFAGSGDPAQTVATAFMLRVTPRGATQ